MLWSDRRSIAEQGCAALWLVGRDGATRPVVVDALVDTAEVRTNLSQVRFWCQLPTECFS